MKKKIGFVLTTVFCVALLDSYFPERLSWKQQKQNVQSDFSYTETIENSDRAGYRYRSKINLNWKFLQDDNVDASAKDFDDSDLRLLNQPHDWSIEGEPHSDSVRFLTMQKVFI